MSDRRWRRPEPTVFTGCARGPLIASVVALAARAIDPALEARSWFRFFFTFPLTTSGSALARGAGAFPRCACAARRYATSRAIRRRAFERHLARSRSRHALPGARETAAYIVGMRDTHELQTIPDDELLRRLADLLGQSRRSEADLVAHVGEVDARRLYAREASPSMFVYCTEVLHLSEAEAYLRIAAARASREHPVLLEMLADGRLHLTAIAKLAPHLTSGNREALLNRAVHKSKRQVEELIAEVAPRPDAPALMRKLPEPRVGVPCPPPPSNSARTEWPHSHSSVWTEDGDLRTASRRSPDCRGAALAGWSYPRRHRAPVVAGRHPGPRRSSPSLRAATRSSSPPPPSSTTSSSGSAASCAPRYPTATSPRSSSRPSPRSSNGSKRGGSPGRRPPERPSPPARRPLQDEHSLRRLEKALRRPRPGQASPAPGGTSRRTRHIPAAVRRAVYERDGGRCAYVDGQGRRCPARDRLEYHHRHPFGHGGRHSVDGISLLCQAHNLHLAEVDYGREAMRRHRRSRTESRSLDLQT